MELREAEIPHLAPHLCEGLEGFLYQHLGSAQLNWMAVELPVSQLDMYLLVFLEHLGYGYMRTGQYKGVEELEHLGPISLWENHLAE